MKRIICLGAVLAVAGAAPAAAAVLEVTVADRSGVFSSAEGQGYVYVGVGTDTGPVDVRLCQRGESIGPAYAYINGSGSDVEDGAGGDPCPEK